MALAIGCLASASRAGAAAEEPLSFAFLDEPPGERVSVGATRLHLHCRGADVSAGGAATVVFETGLGGNALEWSPIADALAPRARVCTYDRAGYAWSDPSLARRDARRLARELTQLLVAADIDGPLIVVAHSFGGLVARLFVEGREDVIGLILVDSSHEEQFERLETDGRRPLVPRSRQFVISGNAAPESLPRNIRRKVDAFARMRKTYSATHGEMAAFRDSADQVRLARRQAGAPHDFPVTVIRRGRDVYAGRTSGAAKTAAWVEMQEDLATLGTSGRLVVAEGSGHHVHADDPTLVVAEIDRLLAPVAPAASGAADDRSREPGSAPATRRSGEIEASGTGTGAADGRSGAAAASEADPGQVGEGGDAPGAALE